MKTKLRYGVSRKLHGKKIECLYGRITIVGGFEEPGFHKKARERILKNHPGYSLMGYCEDIKKPLLIKLSS